MKLWIMKRDNTWTLLSGILIVAGFLLRAVGVLRWGDMALITATVIAGAPIFVKAYEALRQKLFSIELLVSIAVIGALYLREYNESSIVTFLFLFGAYLEKKTLEKTRSSIKKLTEVAPQEAIRLEGGERVTIPIDEVEVGDRLVVLPGGKVPVDGIVIQGEGSIDQSAVTGESEPVTKTIDDTVFSGTILDGGYIEMIAEKVGDDTTFSKIIELVEEAQDSKSKTERFLDRFAHYYTPGVVVLSLLVYLITRDLHLSITFLVVACPGALVIGAPVSNVAGIGNGAKNGVLIKGGEVMEQMAKVDTLIFDKTGTLTVGKPEVTDLTIFGEMDRTRLLALLAKSETLSEHHLGRAILRYADENDADYKALEITEGNAIKGQGLTAIVDGVEVVAGNRKLMKARGIDLPDEGETFALEREKLCNTAVFVAIDGVFSGVASIADAIRSDAKSTLAKMRAKGIVEIIMLTGDNAHTAKAVADQLDIDTYYAELMPQDKVTHVKALKEKGAVVAMAGDGINDAPAIATADIGIAMGKGTDVSMETADIVLMADSLTQYAHAYTLAKATYRNVRQNIAIALIVVAFLLSGVLFGFINLASGMFVHEGSILVVILNAMRLLGFK